MASAGSELALGRSFMRVSSANADSAAASAGIGAGIGHIGCFYLHGNPWFQLGRQAVSVVIASATPARPAGCRCESAQ